ncbi:SDR family oxidoreductase [Enterobacteriaceae bacterium 4M9]|nr:SDR family oxidoreductase [Enterobacteriaceae bacterium 4M9]
MKILVTGSEGFIGKNLCLRLNEAGYNDILRIDRSSSEAELFESLKVADFIFHLAGVNRPKADSEFSEGNVDFTQKIVNKLVEFGLDTPVMISSSTQAERDNPYGISKAAAEQAVVIYGSENNARYFIYRLPNVFGKWCKPNYNSFVATFCHNIAQGKEIIINEPNAVVNLVYIDDVCSELISLINNDVPSGFRCITPVYNATVGQVADLIRTFKQSRENLTIEAVGNGFVRALYSTWLSYLPPTEFGYKIPSYADQRGVFCEMLKTKDAGQFSFFTAHPGITRGGHYHHSKNEKFLVIQGTARFKFEHVITGEKYEINVSPEDNTVIETVPGWSHDVTNTGENELIVMLWANEIFDKNAPDTIARALK